MMNQTTHLSLYGTAVQVVPEAEYQAEIEKKRKENEAQLEAQRKKLEAHQSLMLDLEAKRMRGEATPADQFIAEIRNIDSMMEVWKIWQGYGFDESYEEVDKFIRDAKEVERMYGRSSARVEEKKSKIKNCLEYRIDQKARHDPVNAATARVAPRIAPLELTGKAECPL